MTFDLPPALATAPHPWSLTAKFGRLGGAGEVSPDMTQRKIAIGLLEQCLHVLAEEYARHGDDAVHGLPEGFHELWVFSERGLADRMPTLADISAEGVRHWLAEDIDLLNMFGEPWVEPPRDVVDAVTHHWTIVAVRRLTKDLVHWLTEAMRNRPDTEDRPHYLDLLRSYAARLDWRLGALLVLKSWALTKPRGVDFLEEVANNPDAPERTRAEAADLLRMHRERTPGATEQG